MPSKTLRLLFRAFRPVTRTSGVMLLVTWGCQSEPAPAETPPSVTAAEVVASVASQPSAAASPVDEVPPATSPSTPAEGEVAEPAAATSNPKPSAPKSTETAKLTDTSKPAPSPAAVPSPAAAPVSAAKPDVPAPTVDKPCLATQFTFPAVQAACKKGGVPSAKSLMKAWTNKAKAKGETYKCAACHDNQRTYTNKPNADEDLRKLLALIK